MNVDISASIQSVSYVTSTMEHQSTPERTSAGSFTLSNDQNSSPRRSHRIKKPPPITPRRFNRFFTPRGRQDQKSVRTSRSALKDISGAALNSRQNETRSARSFLSVDLPGSGKRRKLSISSPVSSLQSSPVQGRGFLASSQDVFEEENEDDDVLGREIDSISEASTDIEDDVIEQNRLPKIYPRAVAYRTLSTSASLLSTRLAGRRARVEVNRSNLWQHEAARFASTPTDINTDAGSPNNSLALPFCAVSCRTNPLVAVGDEDGIVRLIDSANQNSADFGKTYLTMKVHENAIMDLEFSEDDAYLASASGDQSCHIVDMHKQTSTWCLTGHTSSIKRVQFQPGSDSKILATCARDGFVCFWDLRTSPTERPVAHFRSAIVPEMAQSTNYINPTNSIREAHQVRTRRQDGRWKVSGIPGRNDFSVTSLSFLSKSRPHLVITASENDAVIKLWDMRTSYTSRRGRSIPMSCTAEPKSHHVHRRFGITSLAMNTDSSKLYALCRDHTVYVYSTSHLVLGTSPEMALSTSTPFKPSTKDHQGLGPMYGLRHPSLRISTFYPKLALRHATDSETELLAVGSSDDCAVIFPTNDRYLTKSTREIPSTPPSFNTTTTRARLTRLDSQTTALHLNKRTDDDDIPIYYHGTPLVRGHNKEVTAVSWTSEGNLLTTSDDYVTRCWRENGNKARELREGAEGEAARWRHGWAAIRDARLDIDD